MFEKVPYQSSHFIDGASLIDAGPELGGTGEAFCVPAQVLAHVQDGFAFIVVAKKDLHVAQRDVSAILKGGRDCRLFVLQSQEVFCKPRIAIAATADHDSVATGFAEHAPGIFGLKDIAAADNRNGCSML
jgi:hypothetical protein